MAVSDTFPGTTLSGSKWSVLAGTAPVSGGSLNLASNSDWMNPNPHVQSAAANALSAGLLVFNATGNFGVVITTGYSYASVYGFRIRRYGADVTMAFQYAGNTSTFDAVPVTTTDTWWKAEVLGTGAVAVWSSADGATWTVRKASAVCSSSPASYTGLATGYLVLSTYYASASYLDINPPMLTSVTAVKAAGSISTKVPTLAFKKVIVAVVATASVSMKVPMRPTLVGPPKAQASSNFPVPVINILSNTEINAPPALLTASGSAPVVIAPWPTFVAPPVAQAGWAFSVPAISIVLNTVVYAVLSSARFDAIPPGEFVRLSAPVAKFSSLMRPTMRVGAQLPVYGASVMQTPENYGGALAYYRLSDVTATMIDVAGQHHGVWAGERVVQQPGAIVNDPDGATFFDKLTTVGYANLPTLNVPTEDPRGMSGNVDPFGTGASQHYSGASVEFWVKTNPGWFPTADPQWTARAYALILGSMTIALGQGSMIVRVTEGSDWQDLVGIRPVNDGGWHQVAVTLGRDLNDETPTGAAWVRLYVDGQLDAQFQSAQVYAALDGLTVGSTGVETGWDGHIDDVSIYDMALTRWQVLEHWNQGQALSGPPLKLEPIAPAYGVVSVPVPTIRQSAVRPLQDLYDAFTGTVLDRVKWRDASPGVRQNNVAILRTNGEQLLTPDYFQCQDSSLIFRIDKLPPFVGSLFLGLVNEHDVVANQWYVPEGTPGRIEFDSFRRHRNIGFAIHRFQVGGRTKTYLMFEVEGQGFNGTNSRSNFIVYVPDDPNFPSPHKWLRLVIDPGLHGGATWSTSPDGVVWTEQYDVHGGSAITSVSLEAATDGGGNTTVVEKTTVTYQDVDDFYLFDNDISYPVETNWRGFMRVKVQASGNAVAGVTAQIDNVNVEPQGSGAEIECSARSALVYTSTGVEYLLFVFDPEIYSSAKNIALEPGPALGQFRMLVPPPPVKVFAEAGTGVWSAVDPQRGGDAIPIQVEAVAASGTFSGVAPARAGDAIPVEVLAEPASGAFVMWPAVEINIDESKPAPVAGASKRNLSVLTRRVTISLTQN